MARFKTTERSGPVKEIADCFKEFSLNTRDVLFEEDVIENFDYTERSPPPFFTAGFTGKNENSAERLVISDTARKTCETVLVGFEMATSENILMNGDIAMDFYNHTENAQKMKYDLDTNEVIWKNYFTPDAIRLHQVHGLLEAIEKHDYTEILKIYYRAQHLHTLNAQDNPIEIPVYINRSQLNRKWVPHIEHAIETINEATPGMNLFETSERKVSKIRIGVDELCGPTMALTRNGSISKVKKKQLKPFIHLGNEWKESQMPGTSIHELMHALRFHHEMQRPDSKMYLDFDKNYDPAYSMKKIYF
ncbi:unnamed protein product [Mytilus edulis]|uniref:Peptidase M12A domain-containing protein n=1 Tax=Mytilus edulis TaxID=6550 RepID=A0A8S3RUC4_MYTED|nr:unnamed protein product [Mytilus edulis]